MLTFIKVPYIIPSNLKTGETVLNIKELWLYEQGDGYIVVYLSNKKGKVFVTLPLDALERLLVAAGARFIDYKDFGPTEK